MDLYKSLKQQLNKKGINIINTNYYNQINLWKSWYQGCVNNFHYYNVKLADGSEQRCERLSMQMPKKVCEDMTKLLWNERVQIKLDKKEDSINLWKILDNKKNNFSIMMPKMLELTSALGTTATTEYLDENGNVVIEYITDASLIVPYSYDNSNITGMVVLHQFIKEENNKQYYYTHLTYHEYKKNIYRKLNELYKSTSSNEFGKEVRFNDVFPEVKEIVEYQTDTPHFQILKMPITNNLDIDIPMGISIFANSIDRLKAIDIKYDSFTNEFINGKKRILVDQSSLKGTPQVDKNGNITTALYFDKNDTTYVALRGMENQPIKEIDFKLRYQEHINSINAELNWLSSNVGFGEDFYSFGSDGVKTATEIMQEDSDAYRTKCAYEIALKDFLYDLVKSVCYLGNIKFNNLEIITDYSRFENVNAVQQRMERELDLGIISKVEYRMKVYNEDEETATKKIKEIEANEPTTKDLLNEM